MVRGRSDKRALIRNPPTNFGGWPNPCPPMSIGGIAPFKTAFPIVESGEKRRLKEFATGIQVSRARRNYQRSEKGGDEMINDSYLTLVKKRIS